ncbi:MAG: sigma-70 family RNA polymerase sigma factor [Christensenellaceae bacterium]|nr:sigma-70 family RNA polymerase sigma factor [Christensenellaceae bacterium]
MKKEFDAAMFALAQKGDAEAMEKLFLSHIALVKSIVRGFLSRGIPAEDLFQIGSIGLIKAIRGFHAELGYSFSTYAVPLISGEIRRFLRDDGMVHISRSIRENAIRIAKLQAENEDLSLSEIAEKLGIEKEEAALAAASQTQPMSIDEPLGKEKDFSLIDTLPAKEAAFTEKLALKDAVSRLPAKKRRMIELHFYHDLTQSQIARIMETSQVQVSRTLKKAMSELKEALQ